MSVSDIANLHKLDAILFYRPAGRNIIGHAIDTINKLRSELADAEKAIADADEAIAELMEGCAKEKELEQENARLRDLLYRAAEQINPENIYLLNDIDKELNKNVDLQA